MENGGLKVAQTLVNNFVHKKKTLLYVVLTQEFFSKLDFMVIVCLVVFVATTHLERRDKILCIPTRSAIEAILNHFDISDDTCTVLQHLQRRFQQHGLKGRILHLDPPFGPVNIIQKPFIYLYIDTIYLYFKKK